MDALRYAHPEAPAPLRLRSAAASSVALIAVVLASIGVWQVAVAARVPESEAAQARMEDRLYALAGPQSENCGDDVRDRPLSLECARSAMAAHRPFRLVRVFQGVDDSIALGVAGDDQGRIWQLHFAAGPNYPIDVRTQRCWLPNPEEVFSRPCR